MVRQAPKKAAPSRMTVRKGGKVYELVEQPDEDQDGDDQQLLEFEEVEPDQGQTHDEWSWPDPNGQ